MRKRKRVELADLERGTAKAFRSIYPPERAAIEQFDDLIEKLSKPATKPQAD